MDMEEVREPWRGLEPRTRLVVVVAAALVVGAIVWHGRSHQPSVSFPADSSCPAAAAAPASSPTPAATMMVDVSGLVRRPGVYQFHEGDRVVDAIRVAGGARRGADLTSLNLAALLTDAEQIVVGRTGGAGPASAIGSGSGGPSGSGASAIVNVNTATLDQLEALPGIGPALGQRIIDYRTRHGPFQSVNDLLNVSGIGEKRLADMKSQVTV